MNYNHLTIEERCCIREYYVKGKSYREIAYLIFRNASTVSREIRRNRTHQYDLPSYYPYTAQKKYLLRRSFCHRGGVIEEAAKSYIEEKLYATWFPEQIYKAPCQYKMPSFKTIYRWIEQKILVNGYCKVLRRKRRPGESVETRGKINYGKSIRKRDKLVYKRKEFANWEQIERELHCEMYFADPYCACQKGTNENGNGLCYSSIFYLKILHLI